MNITTIITSVRNWAEKLGGELWHLGELVTRRNMVIDVSLTKNKLISQLSTILQILEL